MKRTATIGGGANDVWHHITHWASSVASSGGGWLVVVLIMAAAGLIGYAIVLLTGNPRQELKEILEPYRLHSPAEMATTTSKEVVTLPLLQRASQALSEALEAQGWRASLDQKLVRAGLPVGVGEFALVSIAALLIISLLGLLLGGLFGFLVALGIMALLPFAVLQFLADQRTRKFTAQLPDVLQLLAGSLRAGFSLAQGLDAVLEQVRAPMNMELRRALAAARLGMPVEDALTETADRIGSRDFTWTVMAIRIQREVGGNLAEILDTVADTMIQRGRLRREVKTLTAEGRISAIILGALPIVIGMFIYVVNRAYIETLFHTTGGEIALIGAVALELFGAWWMYKTIQIEV
ncbi:MAG TPA: type II secretion system F family protein [Acidimicrobiales bacterium]|nr:type II secretion system F family protein [Acidimicrobiales bacterium]